jgi:hypothetical protein
MSHFAHINEYNQVDMVIVAEANVIENGEFGNPAEWIQTSYNTQAGQHKFGGTPLRKNYAGIGFTYDKQRDAFIPPQPYSSWQLDEDTCIWVAPVAWPQPHGFYTWNEAAGAWDLDTVGYRAVYGVDPTA